MLRNVLGSFASAFVGVLVGGVTLSILFRVGSFEGLVFMCEMVGIATLPVWLLILLPLYTLVPRTSVLWRPVVCTLLGCISEPVLFALARVCGWPHDIGKLLPVAALVGGSTCLFASLTATKFHPPLHGTSKGSVT
jgi:hypothetical protein